MAWLLTWQGRRSRGLARLDHAPKRGANKDNRWNVELNRSIRTYQPVSYPDRVAFFMSSEGSYQTKGSSP